MKILINQEELNKLKSRDLVPFECEICQSTFFKKKHHALRGLKGTRNYSSCSEECRRKVLSKRLAVKYPKKEDILVTCVNCKKEFYRSHRSYHTNIEKTKNVVCSIECASLWKIKPKKPIEYVDLVCNWCQQKFQRNIVSYRQKQIKRGCLPFCSKSHAIQWSLKYHPRKISYRSKLELWLEKKLVEKYPLLEIRFNDREIVGLELDIYIPAYKLAFELNGPFHYEPIVGYGELNRTQRNDHKKSNDCKIKHIDLYVLDCRKVKGKSIPNENFYEIIKNEIQKRIEARN